MQEQLSDIAAQIDGSQEPVEEQLDEVVEQTEEMEAEVEAAPASELLSDLLDESGITQEEFYAYKIKDPATGELQSMQQWKDSKAGMAGEIAELKQAAEQAKMQPPPQQSQYNQQMMLAAGQVQALEQQMNSINWDEQAQTDAGKAMYQKQKYAEAINQAKAQYFQAEQQMNAESNQYQAQNLQHARVQMLQDIPEWSDAAIMKADQDRIRSLAGAYGYSDDELQHIVDPRAVKLMRDYMKLKGQADGAAAAVKQVRKAPRLLKGGSRTQNSGTTEKLVKQARTTGDKNDKLRAMKAVLGG